MSLPTLPYKGARDFYPEDKRLQKQIFSILRRTVESFGYEEYDAPILELMELYTAKTGEEIVNHQTYTFKDRGGRQVAIRPEMTPSVSRMVARKSKQLTYPLRWYSLPNLWRYERPQKGRFREHWQLNVDLFGESSINAEIEIIQVADRIFQSLGADREMYQIKLNSRMLIDHLNQKILKLDKSKSQKLIKLIDKKEKVSASEFKQEAAKLLSSDQLSILEAALETGDIKNLSKNLANSPPAKELAQLISTVKNDYGMDNVVFDPTLARGFDYYNDIVFEIFDTHPDNNRSMMGGGRYDGLVELFGVEQLPTVGFGLGDATLANFIELHKLKVDIKPETQLALLTIGDVFTPANKIMGRLRDRGINVVVDFSERKIANKIKWALSKGVPYVAVLGSQEIENNTLKLKELSSGKEQTLTLDNLVKTLAK